MPTYINEAYKKDRGRGMGALFFAGETYSIYVNADSPINDANFSFFRLDLRSVDTPSLLFTAVGQLQKDDLGDGFYNMFTLFRMPLELPFGFYQLEIFDTKANRVKAQTNYLQVEEIELARNIARVFYRNSVNLPRYGFMNYDRNKAFYNIITLPIIQTGFVIETDRKQYRNVTDRKLRNLNSYIDKMITVESYYFDASAHEAMAVVYEHDSVFINSVAVTAKEGYTIEKSDRSVLSKGSINLYLDETTVNPMLKYLPEIDVYYPEINNQFL